MSTYYYKVVYTTTNILSGERTRKVIFGQQVLFPAIRRTTKWKYGIIEYKNYAFPASKNEFEAWARNK